MPHINIQRSVPFPAPLFEQALEYVLGNIAEQNGPWRDFALHVALGEFGLPDIGYITIPIRLTIKTETVDASAQRRIDLHIETARYPKSSPVFTGTCGVDVVETSHSTVWVDGDYEIPSESILAAIETSDKMGLGQRFEKALQNFVDDLVTACDSHINETEKDFMRYRLLGH